MGVNWDSIKQGKWGKIQVSLMWQRKEQHTCRAAAQTSTLNFATFLPLSHLSFHYPRRKEFRPIEAVLYSQKIFKRELPGWVIFYSEEQRRRQCRKNRRPLINLSSGEPVTPPPPSFSLTALSIRASLMQLLALGVLPAIRSTPLARLSSHCK